MIYICIILGVLLLTAVGNTIYLLKSPSKQRLYEEEFQMAAHEIEERLRKEREEQVNFQSERIRQEIHNMEIMLEEKAKTYKQTQNEWLQQVQNLKESYERQREETTSSIKEHTLKEQQIMTEKLLQKQQEIEKEVRTLDDKYKLTVVDYENKMFDIRRKFEVEEQELNSQVIQKRNEINTLIEQFKKDEEARKEADFYRIPIAPAAQNDINILKGVAAQLNNPATLYKLIWKEYYENGFNAMIGRVLGDDKDSTGIYKITNIKNQMCYIGQTKAGFKNRWRTHVKQGLGCGEQANNRLYDALKKEGIENFTFQVVEICNEKILTERERFYINFYDSKNWGYNSKMG